MNPYQALLFAVVRAQDIFSSCYNGFCEVCKVRKDTSASRHTVPAYSALLSFPLATPFKITSNKSTLYV